VPKPGRNYFRTQDPFFEYNWIGPELRGLVQEEKDGNYEHPDFGGSGNRMQASMSAVFNEQAHPQDFSMKRDSMYKAARQSSSCFVVCHRPSLDAKDNNLGMTDGVRDNHQMNQARDNNHDATIAIESYHERAKDDILRTTERVGDNHETNQVGESNHDATVAIEGNHERTKNDNLRMTDGVGDNHETNQAEDSNHDTTDTIESNHEQTESTEAADDNHGVTEVVSNDNHNEDRAIHVIDANETMDDHQGTDGDGTNEIVESIHGDPEPMQHLSSGDLGHSLHGIDAPNEIEKPSEWMDGFETVIMDGDVIIFFTDSISSSIAPESTQPEFSQPEFSQPESTPPTSTGHLEQPYTARRVHSRLDYFPTPNYPADWPRLPFGPPTQTESDDNYDAKLSGIVFYDEDVPYVIPESSNVALPAAMHQMHPETNSEMPQAVPRGSDESDVGSMLDVTLVDPELYCWFSSDTWTAPLPFLELLSISSLSGSSDEKVSDPETLSSSQEEHISSVQTFDTLMAHLSHGSIDLKFTPCPLTLFDAMAPPFENLYCTTNDTLEDTETEMDVVDLQEPAKINPSGVSAPASDSYPGQTLLHPSHPARPRRWVDRVVDFFAALTRSIGQLRFSRKKRSPCSDCMV
jgi:hypothetical protein